MPSSTSASAHLFDPISGDLLPTYREEYVQGRLPPALAHTVENYLKSSPIQTNIVLGRAHALQAASPAGEPPVEFPLWVQQQLRAQPTASGIGPLRRPAVRLALGLFLVLALASVVQWLRNEPLLPAPVAQAMTRVASSATQATRRLVQQLTAPAAAAPPAPAAPVPVVAKAPARRPLPSRPAALAAMPAKQARVAVLAGPTADSLAPAAASAAPAASVPAVVPAKEAMGLVHGRITDDQGRPLPGATVLVQGTRQVASANASGNYELMAAAGATLQFGYGGYADYTQHNPGTGSVDVTLQPDGLAGKRARSRR